MTELSASDGSNGDDFGFAVAISGNVVVVGAHLTDLVATNAGAAYLYDGNNNWAETKLVANVVAEDIFGRSVAIDGDVVVIGAEGSAVSESPGAAYVFEKPALGWPGLNQAVNESAKLTSLIGAGSDLQLGRSVAVDGDVIVAGAPGFGFITETGIAYVFVEPAATSLTRRRLGPQHRYAPASACTLTAQQIDRHIQQPVCLYCHQGEDDQFASRIRKSMIPATPSPSRSPRQPPPAEHGPQASSNISKSMRPTVQSLFRSPNG